MDSDRSFLSGATPEFSLLHEPSSTGELDYGFQQTVANAIVVVVLVDGGIGVRWKQGDFVAGLQFVGRSLRFHYAVLFRQAPDDCAFDRDYPR